MDYSARRFKELRNKAKLTHVACSSLLGVSVNAVYQWEHEIRKIHKVAFAFLEYYILSTNSVDNSVDDS